jgi:hypothetical protein
MCIFSHLKAGRLLHFTQRPMDHYARTAASEAAAATASMIFYSVGRYRVRIVYVPADRTLRANSMTKNLFGAGHGHGEGHFRTTVMYTAMSMARTL